VSFRADVIDVQPLQLEPHMAADFDGLLAEMSRSPTAGPVAYPLPHPKCLFLRWLAEHKGYLLHGSNRTDISGFEPRDQTDAMQRPVRAVFATADGIWPMYFAIVDRSHRHSLRNGFWRTDHLRQYYFAVNHEMLARKRLVTGAVYVLPPDGFTPCLTPDGSATEEWLNPKPVVPVGCVAVSPEDFPYVDRIPASTRATSFGSSTFSRDCSAVRSPLTPNRTGRCCICRRAPSPTHSESSKAYGRLGFSAR
jgi:hypothetical protein